MSKLLLTALSLTLVLSACGVKSDVEKDFEQFTIEQGCDKPVTIEPKIVTKTYIGRYGDHYSVRVQTYRYTYKCKNGQVFGKEVIGDTL